MSDIRNGKRIFGIRGPGITRTMEFYEGFSEWPGWVFVYDTAYNVHTMYRKTSRNRAAVIRNFNRAKVDVSHAALEC